MGLEDNINYMSNSDNKQNISPTKQKYLRTKKEKAIHDDDEFIDSAYMKKDKATGKIITKLFKTIQERKDFFEEKGLVNSDYMASKSMADYFGSDNPSDKDNKNGKGN